MLINCSYLKPLFKKVASKVLNQTASVTVNTSAALKVFRDASEDKPTTGNVTLAIVKCETAYFCNFCPVTSASISMNEPDPQTCRLQAPNYYPTVS